MYTRGMGRGSGMAACWTHRLPLVYLVTGREHAGSGLRYAVMLDGYCLFLVLLGNGPYQPRVITFTSCTHPNAHKVQHYLGGPSRDQ